MSALRFFAYYGSRFFNERGVWVERTIGGRKMKYHQDLEVVRRVARANLRARTDAKAYIFEVFPIEEGHVLRPTPERNNNGKWSQWAEAKRPTRLVFVEEVTHAEERLITITERVMTGRKSVDDMDDFLRSRGHQL